LVVSNWHGSKAEGKLFYCYGWVLGLSWYGCI
jgi:hypothetical protein